MQELRVWGGGVANAQEDTLSRRVDKNASTLQMVVYKPDHTKGGILIRPKYHRGDRRGLQTFPVLTHMSIRLVPSVMPAELGLVGTGTNPARRGEASSTMGSRIFAPRFAPGSAGWWIRATTVSQRE